MFKTTEMTVPPLSEEEAWIRAIEAYCSYLSYKKEAAKPEHLAHDAVNFADFVVRDFRKRFVD